jgi:hypothetical protein
MCREASDHVILSEAEDLLYITTLQAAAKCDLCVLRACQAPTQCSVRLSVNSVLSLCCVHRGQKPVWTREKSSQQNNVPDSIPDVVTTTAGNRGLAELMAVDAGDHGKVFSLP